MQSDEVKEFKDAVVAVSWKKLPMELAKAVPAELFELAFILNGQTSSDTELKAPCTSSVLSELCGKSDVVLHLAAAHGPVQLKEVSLGEGRTVSLVAIIMLPHVAQALAMTSALGPDKEDQDMEMNLHFLRAVVPAANEAV